MLDLIPWFRNRTKRRNDQRVLNALHGKRLSFDELSAETRLITAELYPALYRLEERRLVTHDWDHMKMPPLRQYYIKGTMT